MSGGGEFRFRHLVPDHGNAPAASRLISVHLRPSSPGKSLRGCEQNTVHGSGTAGAFFAACLANTGPVFTAQRNCTCRRTPVPRFRDSGRDSGRDSTQRLFLSQDSTHSACGAVKHPRQVKPGQQIDASPCQLPGIRSEPRPTEGSSRIRSVCTKSARSPAQPARPGQLAQAHNCASASAPLSAPHDSTLAVVFRPRLITSMRGRSSSDQRLRQGRFFWRQHRPTRATNKDWRLPDAVQRPSAKTKRWSADTKTNNQTLQCCSREPRRNRNHGSLDARPPTADRPAETTLDAELRKLSTFFRFESAAAIFRLNAIFGTRAGPLTLSLVSLQSQLLA